MILHETRLSADDSHDISCLICYFWKSGKIWNCHLLQIIGGALRVKCAVDVRILCLLHMVPWVGLRSVLVAFPGHIHLLFHMDIWLAVMGLSTGLTLNFLFEIPWLFIDFSLTFDPFQDPFGRPILANFIHWLTIILYKYLCLLT